MFVLSDELLCDIDCWSSEIAADFGSLSSSDVLSLKVILTMGEIVIVELTLKVYLHQMNSHCESMFLSLSGLVS